MRKRKYKKEDLSPADLPHNRKEQFFWLVRSRYTTFVKIGAILLLFGAIPLFVGLFGDLSVINVYNRCVKEELGAAETVAAIASARSFAYLLEIPALIVFSVALAGVFRVIRQMVFDESVFFASDLKDGIKASGISFSVNALIVGASLFGCDFFGNLSSLPALTKGFLYALLVFLIIPVCFFAATQSTIYKTEPTALLRNSFILYFKSALQSILAIIICAIPFSALLINNIVAKYIVLAMEIFLLLPYMLTVLYLWCQSVFDKNINERHYPEIFRKGLND